MGTGALSGLRIIDLSSVLMGPYATQLLGDLGADVIWIEDPHGDRLRSMGPGPTSQLSGVAMNLLRNKRSICLNLRRDEGRELLFALLETSDAFLTNLRQGSLERLGLTYRDVAERCPDIVYCQAAGFASDSPDRDAPAYDDIIQASSGIADLYALRDGEPDFSPYVVADKVAGMTVAYGLLAALLHRSRTGNGQHLEVPMTDALRAFNLVEHANAATCEPALAPPGYGRVLTRYRRPKRTSDGWIAIVPYSRESYEALFEVGGLGDQLPDPRMATRRDLNMNADSLYQDVERIVAARPTQFWLEYCRRHRIPASPIRPLRDVVDELPVRSHPNGGAYRTIPNPVRFSRTPAEVQREAPDIGADTGEVLMEIGVSAEQLQQLRGAGVVGP